MRSRSPETRPEGLLCIPRNLDPKSKDLVKSVGVLENIRPTKNKNPLLGIIGKFVIRCISFGYDDVEKDFKGITVIVILSKCFLDSIFPPISKFKTCSGCNPGDK